MSDTLGAARPEITSESHAPILTASNVEDYSDEKKVFAESGAVVEVLEVKVAEEA